MKKTDILPRLSKRVRKDVSKLQRKSFYRVKGYCIDSLVLQLTHFYKDHIRFSVVVSPTPFENTLPALKERRLRGLRIKVSRPPKKKVNTKMSISDRHKIRRENLSRPAKNYVNLKYSTLEKCDWIIFEDIDKTDLPLFISDINDGDHLKEILNG